MLINLPVYMLFNININIYVVRIITTVMKGSGHFLINLYGNHMFLLWNEFAKLSDSLPKTVVQLGLTSEGKRRCPNHSLICIKFL